jgi:predicted alpha-1,2-mannosidase
MTARRAVLVAALVGCRRDPSDVPFPIDEVPLTGFVDPILGTRGPGNAIPGALVPHGVVRASPDTLGENGAIDAYEYDATRIEGFSHTHLEGPGGSFNGYSQLLVLPEAGALELGRDARPRAFSHEDEVARPGYYAVTLEDGVAVELTATGHAAVHRYTFPAGPAHLLVDLGHSLGDSEGGALTVDGGVMTGHAEYVVHPVAALITDNDGETAYTKLYFRAEIDVEPASVDTFAGRNDPALRGRADATGPWIGGVWSFEFDAPTTVTLKVGISFVDEATAARNLDEEVGAAAFSDVATRADAAWNTALNRVQVDGTEDQKRVFYTALYRTFFQPADHTEAGGVFQVGSSGDHVVREADGFRYYSDDWCLWDSYRTSHPLDTLVEPDIVGDVATSLVITSEEGGFLDKCTWTATGYSRVMIGNPAFFVLSDAVVKGIDDFDHDAAWAAVDQTGTTEMADLPEGICGYVNTGTPPEYLELGYVPDECDPGQAASMTLEHAFADWSASRMAAALGRDDDAARYAERGRSWENVWNPDVGYVQSRRRDGSWVLPFDPTDDGAFAGFTEGDAWIYSFLVPHDLPGLFERMGGDDAVVARLDAFFDDGHFDVTNQPSYHVPWLYVPAGRPDKTQERLRALIDGHFRDDPGGLPGNDDSGSTSAWGLFAMLGLYPLAPGDPTWTLSTPWVPRATIHLHPGYYRGGAVQITTVGDPLTMPYVARATWNGEPLPDLRIAHDELMKGGTLEFTLSATPP